MLLCANGCKPNIADSDNISLIFDKCTDRVITSIMTKPNILQKTLFHRIRNSLRFNMGIIFLTSDLMEAARGQKHPSDAENGMQESIYWKKFFIKVAQQPHKPHDGSNQIWSMTSVKKDRSQWPGRSLYSSINATLCCCCWKDILNSRTRPKVLISSIVKT